MGGAEPRALPPCGGAPVCPRPALVPAEDAVPTRGPGLRASDPADRRVSRRPRAPPWRPPRLRIRRPGMPGTWRGALRAPGNCRLLCSPQGMPPAAPRRGPAPHRPAPRAHSATSARGRSREQLQPRGAQRGGRESGRQPRDSRRRVTPRLDPGAQKGHHRCVRPRERSPGPQRLHAWGLGTPHPRPRAEPCGGPRRPAPRAPSWARRGPALPSRDPAPTARAGAPGSPTAEVGGRPASACLRSA